VLACAGGAAAYLLAAIVQVDGKAMDDIDDKRKMSGKYRCRG
jgi:hypothetical protein